MLSVRTATAADAGLIADLSRQTFYDTFSSFNTKEDMELFMSEQFTRDQLEQQVCNDPGMFSILYDGQTPAGYYRLSIQNAPPELGNISALEIARIYIVKQWQGRGAGDLLMRTIHSFAAEHQFAVVWLGVWEKNEPAIRFYKKWGFEKFGEHDFLLGTDVQCDWLMKKELIQQ